MPAAIEVREHGGPEVLTTTQIDTPKPEAGEIVVQTAAAGVNYIDVYHRTGLYPTEPPFVPGLEGAGTVVAVSSDVDAFELGDRVAWASATGSYAEQVRVAADAAVPVPDGVELPVAAALMLQGMTAHYLTRSTFEIKPGDTALVHAGAGGVGLLLIQLIKAHGGRVIATASTSDKRSLATGAGADKAIGYDDFRSQAREFAGGRGVDVVYDGVGKSTFDESLASLRPRGTMVVFGNASGPVPPVEPQRLSAAGSVYLTRPTLGHYTADNAELTWRSGELFDAVAAGTLDVRIGARYPLADAAKAHGDLEARRTTGKLLLIP